MSKRKHLLVELEKISVDYKKLRVIDNLSLYLLKGEIVALMGPNGAGKSTILKAIFGMIAYSGGKIYWDKEMIKPCAHEMLLRSAVYVPQGRAVFQKLTVEENLEMGAIVLKDREQTEKRLEEIYSIFPILGEKRKNLARMLSGGEQQILAIGRGLMMRPKLLLLDEPSLGLSPKNIKEVFEKIKEINHRYGTTILIVEHNIRTALSIADRAYVLKQGRIAYEGSSGNMSDPILKEVFFGKT